MRHDTGMGLLTCSDLAEFGLPLVAPGQPEFLSLVHDIESRPQPFRSWPVDDLTNSAVLLNQSGKAIVAISYAWRYLNATGAAHTSRISNLVSSMQLDVLTGRSGVMRDFGTFILPGSKRLVTERGMFGNNLDVLGSGEESRGAGYTGAGGGGRTSSHEEIIATELILDSVILEDGRCLGPDEFGMVESLGEDLDHIRRTAEQAVTALRNGGSAGEIFDLLRPLARHAPSQQTLQGRRKLWSPFLKMFADMGIRQLIDEDSGSAVAWFETQSQPPRLRLYRPS
jgi:hypothetical protein